MNSGLVFGSLIILLAFFDIAHSSQVNPIPQVCLEPISQSIPDYEPKDAPFKMTGILMKFEAEQWPPNSNKWQVRPQLVISSELSGFLELAKAKVIEKTASESDGIDVSDFEFGQPSINLNRISRSGSFLAEKWWKMDGVCCSGFFSCHRCEWKTKVGSRKVKFVTNIDQAVSLKNPELPPLKELKLTGYADQPNTLQMKSYADINDDRNTLENFWDAVAGMLEGVESLFNGHDKMQLGDYLGSRIDGGNSKPLEPEVFLSDNLIRLAYSPATIAANKIKSYESGSAWQALNSSFFFDAANTGFYSPDAGPYHDIYYGFDVEAYLKKIGRMSNRLNMLNWTTFCDYTKKTLKDEYLPNLAKKISGKDIGSDIAVEGTVRNIKLLLREKYGVGGVDEYYRGNYRPSESNKEIMMLLVSSKDSLALKPGIMPANGSLSKLSKEQNWAAAEYKCARKLAISRTGSSNKVFPFQNFETCMRDLKSDYAIDAWNKVEQKLFDVDWVDAVNLMSPIVGDVQYRGWYYCSRNPSICSGNNSAMWITSPSHYNSRAGRHLGMDIIDGSPDETINLKSVAEGQLIYHGSNMQGWGHSLLLPFLYNGIRYIAVYAHLPAEAKKLDGRKVLAGESIGVAGCSGNAGDGLGKCNNYCDVGAFKASDIHLHFELLKDNGGSKTSIDPQSVIKFIAADTGQTKLYSCQ